MDRDDESTMFFLSRAIALLRPSILEGFPIGNIHLTNPILSFSEASIQNTVDFFEEKFNVTPGQLELLKFIQNVHRIHRNVADYQGFWNTHDRPAGPLFLFIFMDDYHNLTNWQYKILTPENINEADLSDEDRNRIEEEMQLSPPHRFKINYLFVEKTEQFPDQKFLMEIWDTIPSEDNDAHIQQIQTDIENMFQSLRNRPFDIYSHSELVLNLIDSHSSDLFRKAFEHMSMDKELEPFQMAYYQFFERMRELISNAKIPEVVEAFSGNEGETVLMVYRMTEAEEMKQYRDTYGPIVRLTRTVLTDYITHLEQEESDEYESQEFRDYEVRFYKNKLECLLKMEQGSLNLLFLHEGWQHDHDEPFACLIQNPTEIN